MIKNLLNFKLLTAALAIALSAAFFAFAPSAESNVTVKQTPLWYQYNGSATDDPTDEANYDVMATQPANSAAAAALCPNSGNICVVQAASGTSGHPANFSSAFSNEITTALSSGNETPAVKLRD